MARPRKTVSVHDKTTVSAEKLRKIQEQEKVVLNELGALFRQGRDDKVTVTSMTTTSGLSRSTVYRLLNDNR